MSQQLGQGYLIQFVKNPCTFLMRSRLSLPRRPAGLRQQRETCTPNFISAYTDACLGVGRGVGMWKWWWLSLILVLLLASPVTAQQTVRISPIICTDGTFATITAISETF